MSIKLTNTKAIAACDDTLGKKLTAAGEAARRGNKAILDAACLAYSLGYSVFMFLPYGHGDLEASDSFALDVRDKIAAGLSVDQRRFIGKSAAEIRDAVGEDALAAVMANDAAKQAGKIYKDTLRVLRTYLEEIQGGLRLANGKRVKIENSSGANRKTAIETLVDKLTRFDDTLRGVDLEKLNTSNDHIDAIMAAIENSKAANRALYKALNAALDQKAESKQASPSAFDIPH